MPSATRGSFYKNRPWTPQKFLLLKYLPISAKIQFVKE